MAFWPGIIRAVDFVEGGIGTALNCAVIYLLWSRKYTSNLLPFRICITITAVQGLLISGVVITFANTVHLFHYENIQIIIYGFLATLNESFGRFLIYFSLFSTFCVWQLIPGACLLQYFTLCKPLSRIRRFIVSYGLCIVMLIWSTPYLLSFYPSAAFDELVRTVHHPNSCDAFVTMGSLLLPTEEHTETNAHENYPKTCYTFVTMGSLLMPTDEHVLFLKPKAMLNLAVECVIPTYTISYGIFAFCAVKCRGILISLNITFSEKTLAMHRKFLMMLALQNLLPLIVLSLPIGIFITAVIGGYPMGLMTLVVSFSYWTLPVIQGSVSLLFVIRATSATASERSKSFSLTRP